MKDPSANRNIVQKTYDQKWNNPYVEKAESDRKKNTTQKMNNDLKTTQTVLLKRKTEEIFNFLSRNCAKPQPPRDLRHPTALRPRTS